MVNKADGEIVYKIEVDDSSYKKSFKDFEKEAGESGKKAGESLNEGLGDIANEIVDRMKEAFQSVSIGDIIIDSIAAGAVGVAVGRIQRTLTGAGGFVKEFGVIFKQASRSIFGMVEIIGAVGIGLTALGSAMGEAEGKWTRIAGKIVFTVGLITNAISFGIIWAFKKLGQGMVAAGSEMVKFFKKAADGFAKFDRDAIVLESFIESFNRISDESVGSIDEWSLAIDDLSSSLNTSVGSLRQASGEIISIGHQLGLSRDQMMKLLEVSTAYGKIAHKDVFQTSVAITAALNGNAQAVQSYGIKLNQAAVQHFAFTKGVTKSLNELSEHEMVQLRFNKLLKQYSTIAGVASDTAGTLADQSSRYKVITEKLNASLGKGAAIIESNNIGLFAMNTILSSVNENVLAAIGFLGSLAGRLLQVIGLSLQWSFTIFAVVKAFRLLDAAVKTGFAFSLLNKTIPLINRSMLDLVKIIPGIGTGMKQSAGLAGNALMALKNAFSAVFSVVWKFAKILFNVKTLLVGTAIFLVTVFTKAMAAVEDRTRVFTTLWQGLTDTVGDSESVFSDVANVFTEIKDAFVSFGDKAFGLLISGLTQKMLEFLQVLSLIPFLSDKMRIAVNKASMSLGGLKGQLADVGFAFSELPGQAMRGLASMNKAIEVNLKQLSEIRTKFGQSEIEKLKSQFDSQNSTIQNAFMQQLIGQKEFQAISARLYTEYLQKLEEIRLKQEGAFAAPNESIAQSFQNIWEAMKTTAANVKITATQIAKTMHDNIANGAANAFSSFGQALVEGENALGAFVKSLLGTMGQMAVQLGTMFIAQGLAYLWAGLPNGGSLIAAGAALATIGGALAALSGGGASMSTAGSETFSASPEISSLTQEDEIEKTSGTEINVVVQGNVLDRRETGLEIVRTINEVVESDNVTINRRALA